MFAMSPHTKQTVVRSILYEVFRLYNFAEVRKFSTEMWMQERIAQNVIHSVVWQLDKTVLIVLENVSHLKFKKMCANNCGT